VISCDSVLRKYAGILSGPVSLWGFRLCKRLAIPSTETDTVYGVFPGRVSHLVLETTTGLLG